MRSFSAASAASRASRARVYSRILTSSSFSRTFCSSLRLICSEFDAATSSISALPASFLSICCASSSSFIRSISLSMMMRSWSRSSSWRMRSRSRSWICSSSTLAPRLRSSMRCASRTSYCSSALMRSISIMRSCRRFSSSASSIICFFSSICASRMVTHLEYSIIWFMCFTASSCSSIRYSARVLILAFAAALSRSVSVSGAFFLASSASRSIFSLRAFDTACASSRLACKSRRVAAMSSAVMTMGALSIRSKSDRVTVTISSRGLPLFGFVNFSRVSVWVLPVGDAPGLPDPNKLSSTKLAFPRPTLLPVP
mmetsp:Transcript_12224/g.29793  ORF Transcript_12224/g.29793 Transcript_12224/m.29793 type:complete len:313 (-) Transcript_12224:172-1110(-)